MGRSSFLLSWARIAALALAAAGPASAAGEGLSAVEQRLVARVEANRGRAIDLLRRAVDQPSATENLAGVRKVGALFAAELAELGFATRWVELSPAMGRAGHLVAESGVAAGGSGPRILMIGHLEGARAYGSGASDMKGGDVVIVEALRALVEEGLLAGRRVVVVLTGDEEDPGEPHATSRAALVEAAGQSDLALAFEGWVPGVAVVGRRGIATWRLETSGSGGHSSRILAAFRAELPEPYLTLNPGVVVGGTEADLPAESASGTATGKSNVVAAKTIVEGDLRFLTAEQRLAAEERMRAIVARSAPQTRATLSFGPCRRTGSGRARRRRHLLRRPSPARARWTRSPGRSGARARRVHRPRRVAALGPARGTAPSSTADDAGALTPAGD